VNPYFVQNGVASWGPSPGDTEVPSLQKINALLVEIVNNLNGGGSSGPYPSLKLTDTVTGYVWTLTIANGVLEYQ
jgi:hypothetical protein